MNLRGCVRRNNGAPAPDRGFSLVEIIITIVLMSTVLIAVMNASITGIRASSAADDLSQIETVLQNAADRVNRAGQRCDYFQFVDAARQSAFGALGQATATYQWYQPGPTPLDAGQWKTALDGSACSVPNVAGKEVQLVTITITSPNGRVSRSMQVVKSNV